MNTNDYTIRSEKEEDYRDVENLVRESFWNVYRPGCSEHYVIHVLRDDPAFVKELDFVMEQDGRLIGQNIFCQHPRVFRQISLMLCQACEMHNKTQSFSVKGSIVGEDDARGL